MMNRYFIDYNLKNGLGNPSINLYLTGCDIPVKCVDCHNYEIQEESKKDYNLNNIKMDLDEVIKHFLILHDKLYFCILGGEPLTEYNKPITLEISKYIKNKYPDSIIVLYSWRKLKILKNIDFGVLGAYNKDLFTPNTIPSSSNQIIWDYGKEVEVEPIIINKGDLIK